MRFVATIALALNVAGCASSRGQSRGNRRYRKRDQGSAETNGCLLAIASNLGSHK